MADFSYYILFDSVIAHRKTLMCEYVLTTISHYFIFEHRMETTQKSSGIISFSLLFLLLVLFLSFNAVVTEAVNIHTIQCNAVAQSHSFYFTLNNIHSAAGFQSVFLTSHIVSMSF